MQPIEASALRELLVDTEIDHAREIHALKIKNETDEHNARMLVLKKQAEAAESEAEFWRIRTQNISCTTTTTQNIEVLTITDDHSEFWRFSNKSDPLRKNKSLRKLFELVRLCIEVRAMHLYVCNLCVNVLTPLNDGIEWFYEHA